MVLLPLSCLYLVVCSWNDFLVLKNIAVYLLSQNYGLQSTKTLNGGMQTLYPHVFQIYIPGCNILFEPHINQQQS